MTVCIHSRSIWFSSVIFSSASSFVTWLLKSIINDMANISKQLLRSLCENLHFDAVLKRRHENF